LSILQPLLAAGIDIGSTYTKGVVVDQDRVVRARAIRLTGFRPGAAAQAIYEELAAAVGGDRLTYVATTGYGRYMAPMRHAAITELTSHGFATVCHFPTARTILDIGGQDIKAMRIDPYGRVQAFRLNDKCAAGTGAFLEKTAHYLSIDTADIAPYALRSTRPVKISSVCAVFAESEVISHLAEGVCAEDIIEGAITALADRSVQLVRRVGLEPELVLVGGMTQNPAMVAAIEAAAGGPLRVPPDGLGQLNGAYGAALLGLGRAETLLAAGRPIPPPGTMTASSSGGIRRRRWGTYVSPAQKACSPQGCPIFVEIAKRRPAEIARE
jgi:predicted CoA-substrate-specific enzyme activase